MSERKKEQRYVVRLTLDEINALLGAVNNVDHGAMAEDYSSEAEGDAFLLALHSAIDKLGKSS